MTAMSERALIYLDESLAHRTVVLYEAVALREGREKTDDNQTAYIVRSLLSEGQIEYPTVVRDDDGPPRTVWVVKEGPTNLLTTTTSVSLHAENETRMLSLPSDDSKAQTARGDARRMRRRGTARARPGAWHELQCWLAQARHEVVIPFARCIAAQIPPKAARLRRDWNAVRSLVRAHAMLHQLSRETDDAGPDHRHDRRLHGGALPGRDLVAEAVGATVPAACGRPSRSSPTGSAAPAGAGVRRREGRGDRQPAEDRAVGRAAPRADRPDRGYLVNLEDKRGRPGRYVLGDQLPGETAVLPPPEQVCTGPSCAHQVHTLRTPGRTREPAGQRACRRGCAGVHDSGEGCPEGNEHQRRRQPMSSTVEAAARAMAKPERAAHLRACGWQSVSYGGVQSWRAPGSDGHRWWTLAAAIREQLRRDRRRTDCRTTAASRSCRASGQATRPRRRMGIRLPRTRGREHTHSAEPGHRVSHCSHALDPGYITAPR